MEDPTDLDEVVKLCNPVVVPAFGSSIVKGRTAETMMMTMKLNVMTQAPYAEDRVNLPVSLYVLRMRCDMNPGSQSVHLVLQNRTARPIRLSPGRVIGRVVTVNEVPKVEASPKLLRELGMDDKPKEPKMTIPERQVKLMEILEENSRLDMLKDWPEEEAHKAQ